MFFCVYVLCPLSFVLCPLSFVFCPLSFVPIGVIYSEQSPCKGSNFAEPDEQALVYLALWCYEDSAEQQYQPAYREHRRCN